MALLALAASHVCETWAAPLFQSSFFYFPTELKRDTYDLSAFGKTTTADVNDDGRPDVVVAPGGAYVSVFYGTGDGMLGNRLDLETNRNARSVACAVRQSTARPTAPAQPGDELWWDGFGLPATDGYVVSAIEFQGSIVIGGQFSRVGDIRANNIARWDGSQWRPLGSGVEWGGIDALTIFQGDLVAAGGFTWAGGILARGIAHWNGTSWAAFGAGFHDLLTNTQRATTVFAYRDTLIAAGEFSYSGGNHLPGLARWGGTEWTPFGSGMNGPIHCFAVKDDTLYAGGAFDSAGAVPASGIARWSGSAWAGVAGGVEFTWSPREVWALSVYEGRLIVGGRFDHAGALPVDNIAAWDGTSWAPMGPGLPQGVSALTVKEGTLFAAGGTAIARWDGLQWAAASPSLYGSLTSMIPYGDDLVVAGGIEVTNPNEDHPTAVSIARLSGGTWHAMVPWTGRMHGLAGYGGSPAYAIATVFYRGRLLATGSIDLAGDPPHWVRVGPIAAWDGSQWAPFPSPPGTNQIVSLIADGDTLYAGGSFVAQKAGDPSFISVYRYDGTKWVALEGPPVETWAMVLYGGGPYQAGSDWSALESTSIVRCWNGAKWDVIGRAQGGDLPLVAALAVHDGKLVASGRFLAMNGVPAANIAVWDGAAWQQLGPGLPSPAYFPQAIVRALAVHDGFLVAAGEAVAAGPVGSSVTRWSGSAWEPLGGRIGEVSRLGSVAGELLASGILGDLGNSSASHYVTRWNGHAWEPLGSGTDGPVSSFAARGNSVYMCGPFSGAGGRASFSIARWEGLQSAVSVPSLHVARPNPFGVSTSFSYTLPAAGVVRLTVHDIQGREVAVLENSERVGGDHEVEWDGRDRFGRKLPSGVYFIRAAMPGGVVQTGKAVLLR